MLDFTKSSLVWRLGPPNMLQFQPLFDSFQEHAQREVEHRSEHEWMELEAELVAAVFGRAGSGRNDLDGLVSSLVHRDVRLPEPAIIVGREYGVWCAEVWVPLDAIVVDGEPDRDFVASSEFRNRIGNALLLLLDREWVSAYLWRPPPVVERPGKLRYATSPATRHRLSEHPRCVRGPGGGKPASIQSGARDPAR